MCLGRLVPGAPAPASWEPRSLKASLPSARSSRRDAPCPALPSAPASLPSVRSFRGQDPGERRRSPATLPGLCQGTGHRCFGGRHHQPLTSAALWAVAWTHGPDPAGSPGATGGSITSPSFLPTSRRCTSHDGGTSPDLRGTVSLNTFTFLTPSVAFPPPHLCNEFYNVEETTCFEK